MKQRQQYRQLYCVLHNFHNPHLHLPKPVGERGMEERKGTRKQRKEKESEDEVEWEGRWEGGGRGSGSGQMVPHSLFTYYHFVVGEQVPTCFQMFPKL